MRVRLRFTKLGKIRFTSQRDVARMWERALRRAALPLAYTEGFSPRPQLSFGLALPTGCESRAEYLDVVLDDSRPEAAGVEVDSLPAALTPLLPAGIVVEESATVDRGAGSLQQLVTSCSWIMRFAGVSRAQLDDQVAALLASDTLVISRERKGRQERDDLRPSVLALAVSAPRTIVDGVEVSDQADAGAPGPVLETAEALEALEAVEVVEVVAELATQPRGVRPIELVRGLIAAAAPANQGTVADGATIPAGCPVLDRACRTQQWIERDGLREEPLRRRVDPAGVGRATHALERAS